MGMFDAIQSSRGDKDGSDLTPTRIESVANLSRAKDENETVMAFVEDR